MTNPHQMEILRALDLVITPDMDEQTRLARELLALGRERVLRDHDNNIDEEERSSFLDPTVLPRVQEIGQRLHEINPSLLFLFFELPETQILPSSDRKELEYAWDGIGEFLA